MTENVRQTLDGILRLLNAGNVDAGEQACREALAANPDDVNLIGLMGAIQLKKGDWDAAETLLLSAVELEPAFARPHEDLGALYLARNQPEKAVPCFEQAVVLTATESSLRGLAVALQRSGREADAAVVRRRLAESSPGAKKLAEANELRRAGEPGKAEKICQDLLRNEPENIAALHLLAVMATEQEQFIVAEGFLRRIIQAAPNNVTALLDFGRFLADRGRYPDAIELLSAAAPSMLEHADAQLLLGDMLAIVGRSGDALEAYESCLRLQADEPAALLGRGHMLRIEGRTGEAEESYRRCAQARPEIVDAWWNLASLRRYTASDDEISTMQAQLDANETSADARVPLQFALARAYEAREEYDKAWRYYVAGNAEKRSLVKYDPVETELQQRNVREVFNQALFEREAAATPTDRTPIFILGVPRSGSTLIEQIIASHSQVEGTGELPYVIMMTNALAKTRADERHYPEVMTELGASEKTGLGRSYLHHAASHCSAKLPFFTDKMPANFLHAGFIRLILPHAKIIDARRHPLATCIANYRQLFAQGKNQSYDLVELGEYYLQYIEMMDHWDAVMPGAILRMQYEDVVADLPAQVHRLLDFCGLPFEEQCVEFHKSSRPVNTASAEQVREPIYRSGVEFWKNYESHLDELREVLAPVL